MKIRSMGLVGVCLAIIGLAPFIGASLDGPTGDFVLRELRVPRVLMAALVGATLSIVGAAYQTVLANPLATPSTVGTTAGASLGAILAVTFGVGPRLAGLPLVVLCAFAGALAVTLALTAIASRERARLDDVLLMGIALSLATSAIATGVQFTADNASLIAAVQWSLGHLPQVGYQGIFLLAPFALVTTITLLAQTRALDTLLGGEERAHGQGVDVGRVRALVLGTGALGVSACVAWCGPIAFVGLVVPHLVRLLVGASRRRLLPISIAAGAGFLVLCDTAARVIIPGRELPVGVITAAIGAPALVWLVARRRHASTLGR